MKNVFFSVLMLIMLSGCDNGSKDSSAPITPSYQYGSAYSLRNGSCYLTSTGQQVDNSYCYSSNGNNYGSNYGNNNRNNYGNNYGNNNGYGNNYGGNYNGNYGNNYGGNFGGGGMNPLNGGQCYGTYIFSQSGYAQFVSCYGVNCSGYTLIQLTSGAPVFCR